MGLQFAEVFGIGHVALILGGRFDGNLIPLSALVRKQKPGVPINPADLQQGEPLEWNYNLNTDALQTVASNANTICPGERLFSTTLLAFTGYVECNSLQIPKLSVLLEQDMNVGIRGGVIADNSFLSWTVDEANKLTPIGPLSMGEDVLTAIPPCRALLKQFQAEWASGFQEITKTGTSPNGLPFDLKCRWIGSTAAIGTISAKCFATATVFLLLSGKSEPEELRALALAQEQVQFITRDSDVWKQIGRIGRLLLIDFLPTCGGISMTAELFAWVFFRKVGLL